MLHAKFYIFDDNKCIITSANLTASGLKRNFEYGIITDESMILSSVVNDYAHMLSNEQCGYIGIRTINKISSIIDSIPQLKLKRIHGFEFSEGEDIFDLDIGVITNYLSGWNKDVFLCINQLENPVFSLNDVNQFVNDLSDVHPNNHHVKAKIRQTLQHLRDIGLIKFMSAGIYKKLWT
jgi:hypothetical protein